MSDSNIVAADGLFEMALKNISKKDYGWGMPRLYRLQTLTTSHQP